MKKGKMKAYFKGWWKLALFSAVVFALSSIVSAKFLITLEGWEKWGLIGIFSVALISNSTPVFPIAGLPVAIALSESVHPLLVTFIYTLGALVGESTMYGLGYLGKGVFKKAEANEWYRKSNEWLGKYGHWTIFAFASLPLLPFDLLSLTAGRLKYPFWKYIVFLFFGRFVKYTIVIVGGFEVINRFFKGRYEFSYLPFYFNFRES